MPASSGERRCFVGCFVVLACEGSFGSHFFFPSSASPAKLKLLLKFLFSRLYFFNSLFL